jgi:hypothetical protein
MVKEEVRQGPGGRIVIMDSITKLGPEDDGAVIVSASHGGASSGEFALAVPVALVFFNDAGVGKDDAGIAALHMLQSTGVAAGTVAHTSGRIGDSRDMWEHGEISWLNQNAEKLGLRCGVRLKESLESLVYPK